MEAFGRSFGHFDRGAGQQNLVFAASRGVPTISCFRRPSGKAFGWYLEALVVVQSCFFTVLFVVGS